MAKQIIKIIEVKDCYDCPYCQASGECKLLKDCKKKPLLSISVDCPLTDREVYVRAGVVRNLEKVWGKNTLSDEHERSRKMEEGKRDI